MQAKQTLRDTPALYSQYYADVWAMETDQCCHTGLCPLKTLALDGDG